MKQLFLAALLALSLTPVIAAPAWANCDDLVKATVNQDRAAVEQQLSQGVSVNCVDNDLAAFKGTPPIMLAIAQGDASTVALFISKGANVNLANPNGKTPLGMAQDLAHDEDGPTSWDQIVQMLKKAGAKT